MTVEKCWAACKGNGFRYAGLLYYEKCRCGGAIQGPLNTGTTPSDTCSYKCDGNKDQICGGSNKYSVYVDPTYPSFDPTTAHTGYTAEGCYKEIPGKALVVPQEDMEPTTMTVDRCLRRCGSLGYAWSGVEYGRECYVRRPL